MSKLLPRLKQELAVFAEAAPRVRGSSRSPLDLIHLARQSLGDKSREMEILGHFDRQAGLMLDRLRSLSADPAGAGAMARILAASAKTAGAFAVGSASEAYAATLAAKAPERERLRALEILEEEIGIVRATILDLLSR